MNKNTQTVVSVLIVIAFIIGGIWYYQSMQPSQPNAPFVPPIESTDRGGMQLPTGAPHVTPPTTPPPGERAPSR